eukprot:8888133-Alexandrium_andersonii.AAC.1
MQAARPRPTAKCSSAPCTHASLVHFTATAFSDIQHPATMEQGRQPCQCPRTRICVLDPNSALRHAAHSCAPVRVRGH